MAANLLDLTTVDTFKLTYGIPSADTAMDLSFQRWITAASRFMARYCNRAFIIASFTETRNGNGYTRLILNNYPIVAIASVNSDGQVIPVKAGVNGNGYYFTSNSLYADGFAFGARGSRGAVVVVYTAGLFANTAAAAGSDLEQACLELVAQKWKRRSHIDQVSVSMGGAVTESFSTKDLPAEVATVLQMYMNPVAPDD